MAIKKSLQIWIISFTLIPLLFISIISYTLITNKVYEVNEDHMNQLIYTSSTGLETLLKQQKTELQLMSSRSEIAYLIGRKQFGNEFSNGVNSLLSARKYLNSYCKRISLYNAERRIIASTDYSIIGNIYKDNISIDYMDDTKQFAIARSGICIDESTFGKNLGYIEIGYPIFSTNDFTKITGYLVSEIDLSYFSVFLDNLHIGKSGRGMIIDKDGFIVYNGLDEKHCGDKIESDTLASLYSEYSAGNANSKDYLIHNFNGKKIMTMYTIIPEVNWIMLINQDYSELDDISSVLIVSMTICAIVIFLILYIVIHQFSKSFTAPILSLRDAMRKASNGDLTVQSNIKANNELGELSKSFNKMIHIIKTNYDDLSSMHEELLINEEQLRSNYEHIEYLAYHDILTSLPNKLAFLEYVDSILMSQKGAKETHAIFFVDLDNFKTVNDTLGHEYGDTLLAKISLLLKNMLRKEDMLARAGGDEFLILLHNIEDTDYALDISTKILQALKEPLQINEEMLYVSMSIGISIYPFNGANTNILIKYADIAMYHSKETGKNKATLFNKHMEEMLNRNTVIIDILRNAIANKEVFLVYQPQFDLNTDKIIGYETLMRINSLKLGSISPVEFIPVAEECGLINELGEWALLEACRFNMELIEMGLTPCPISVNISSIQINNKDFVNLIRSVLDLTGLPPQLLELEITESTLISTVIDANQLFTNLVQLGVRISLDDFGTGYSSLNYLTRIPINTLKIDKSFIDNICSNPKDCYVSEAIIRLAHNLDVRVIAEGVEHKNQVNILKKQQCDMIQGYIYSKPLSKNDLIALLKKKD